MKVITWKEMFELEGDVVWSYYNEEEPPSGVFIQYHNGSYKRVCEESFPPLVPEFDYHPQTINRFDREFIGEVSHLNTTSDTYSREEEDTLIIIYDEDDISTWIGKLQILNINY